LLKEIRGETRERRILKMLGKDYINSDQAIPALLELLAELDWEPHSVAAGGAQG